MEGGKDKDDRKKGKIALIERLSPKELKHSFVGLVTI